MSYCFLKLKDRDETTMLETKINTFHKVEWNVRKAGRAITEQGIGFMLNFDLNTEFWRTA